MAPIVDTQMIPAPPPALEHLPRGTQLYAGMGRAEVLPDMDFETYSEAGYVRTADGWGNLPGAAKKGLSTVGAARYAEHPSTEITSFYYDLKDGTGRQFWRPGMPNPEPLLAYIRAGGRVEAWNVGFERWIWEKICAPKLGWPSIAQEQYRCAMAKGRAFCLPGALSKAGEVLNLQNKKNPDGDRLLKKFAMPRKPTAKDKRTRIRPEEDPVDGPLLYAYNERDIIAEAEASSRIPDLEGEELQFWFADQECNHRGVAVDVPNINNCIAIINEAHTRYNSELARITHGEVQRASELAKLVAWFAKYGVGFASLDEEHIEEALARPNLPAWARRPLEIRQAIGSAAVKKVFAMANQVTAAGRLHDLFLYYGARTGRATGSGPQPTNLPNSGPPVKQCGCGKHFGMAHTVCPWCAMPQPPGKHPIPEWCAEAAADVLVIIEARSLDLLEYYFGDAMAAISGCLRGLFIAPEGYDLVCSDYSSIEAVVLAMISGEQWRIDVFRTHGKIYEAGAAKITGIPFEEFMRHAGYTDEELAKPDWYLRKPATKGSHHPMRKKIGKVSELASGYQGWIGSWIAFGADEFMNEPEMKKAILAWRAASPSIVEFWGGQQRGRWGEERACLFGVEGMFIAAVQNPGVTYEFRGFEFTYRGDILFLKLLSGRYLHYHKPRLRPSSKKAGTLAISYEGNNTNPKNGPVGWIRMDTWGGRLVENIVQAVARDILRHAMVNMRGTVYEVVLHVYDEIVAQVKKGLGSVQEFERIMATMPAWAAGWPIKAAGGWRQARYSK